MSGAAPVPRLTHLDEAGQARMVDVSAKDVTVRTARASGRVVLSAEAVAALRDGQVPKGDALAVARIARQSQRPEDSGFQPTAHGLGETGDRRRPRAGARNPCRERRCRSCGGHA